MVDYGWLVGLFRVADWDLNLNSMINVPYLLLSINKWLRKWPIL